jgi:hypothetical protein
MLGSLFQQVFDHDRDEFFRKLIVAIVVGSFCHGYRQTAVVKIRKI